MKMPFIKVGTVAQLPADSVMEVMVGDQPYALCNVGGTLRALSGVCLHRGGPLGQDSSTSRGSAPITSGIDCTDRRVRLRSTGRVPTYEVKVEADDFPPGALIARTAPEVETVVRLAPLMAAHRVGGIRNVRVPAAAIPIICRRACKGASFFPSSGTVSSLSPPSAEAT
jgi:nitrite reductase/ring-hydroxylating ferredoxin subunit